jgi:tetratricopeptide (TPR) repeat protein
MSPQTMSPEQRREFALAYNELVAAESVNEDRPEAHLDLGLLQTRQGQPIDAETEYQTALRLDPNFVPALSNLADLERMRGLDEQGAGCCARRFPSSRKTRMSRMPSVCFWCVSMAASRGWDVLVALMGEARGAGDLPTVLLHVRELAKLDPGDLQVRMLLRDLENRRDHRRHQRSSHPSRPISRFMYLITDMPRSGSSIPA